MGGIIIFLIFLRIASCTRLSPIKGEDRRWGTWMYSCDMPMMMMFHDSLAPLS